MQDVLQEPVHMTWTVTPVDGFTNVVLVDQRITTRLPFTILTPCGGTPGQPTGAYSTSVVKVFRMCISSTEISPCSSVNYAETGYAHGSFTTNQMNLSWWQEMRCSTTNSCHTATTKPGGVELFKG